MTDTDLAAGRREILLACLGHEWADHIQTRAQTWKTLEIEAAIAIGMVSIDWKLENKAATTAAALLVCVATAFGVAISFRHRRVEQQKFTHISRIEQELGLLGAGNIFEGVHVPDPISFRQALSLKSNTALFILRMHLTLAAFAVVFAVARLSA